MRGFPEGGASKSLRSAVRLEGGLGAPCSAVTPPVLRLFFLPLFYNPSSFLSSKTYLSWWVKVNSKAALAWPLRLFLRAPAPPSDKPTTQTLSAYLTRRLCLLLKAELPCPPNASSLTSVYPQGPARTSALLNPSSHSHPAPAPPG